MRNIIRYTNLKIEVINYLTAMVVIQKGNFFRTRKVIESGAPCCHLNRLKKEKKTKTFLYIFFTFIKITWGRRSLEI